MLNEDGAIAQMRLATRLWNVLVAIERTRVERYRHIMRDEMQERIDVLRERISKLREEINARRSAARKRQVDTSDLKTELGALKGELSVLIEQRKADAKERHEAKRAELTALAEKSNQRIKRARQAAARMGLFWGTYNDIVQRADSGKKHGGELRFRGFRGEGTITAQIVGGATVERCLWGDHTFFQIEAPVAGRRWRYARMRIGSTATRAPVWVEIPIVYHRDMPPHGLIKSVSMTRRLVADKVRWQLNVTVNTDPPEPKKEGMAVAIDIGWRLLSEGVRVGYWMDEGGQHGQVVVPASDIEQFEKIKSLRSICDQMRDEEIPKLAAWLGGVALPKEWAARSAHLIQWRSSDRLAALIAWWRDNRLDGDQDIFTDAIAWRKQYLHLSQWWRNLQDQMTARLREYYRVFAAGVANRYATVFVEEFDLRQVAELPRPESDKTQTASSGYRHAVSPSTLRAAIVNAAHREGLRIDVLPPEFTTQRCHRCGHDGEWDQAESVIHRCEKCGQVWDQDYNAAVNLLAIGMERALQLSE